MEKVKLIVSYLFSSVPSDKFSYYIPTITVALLLLLGAVVFSLMYNKKKKEDFAFKRIFKKTASRLTFVGLLLLFLIAVRYEAIPYFAMRIWMYLGVLLTVFILYRQVKFYFKDYPKERHNMISSIHANVSQKEASRYLPNKKKK